VQMEYLNGCFVSCIKFASETSTAGDHWHQDGAGQLGRKSGDLGRDFNYDCETRPTTVPV
jgi:hypothetical protein